MNSLDLAMLAIVAVSVTVAMFRGIVRELFSLAAVFLGFYIAMHYYKATSDSFLRLTSYPHINNIISFIGIFVFSAVLISFIGGRISGAVSGVLKASGLKIWDHVLGVAVGALKGVVICLLITYALMIMAPADSHILKGSKAFPYFSLAVNRIMPVEVKTFEQESKKKLEELKKDVPSIPSKDKEPVRKEKTPPKG